MSTTYPAVGVVIPVRNAARTLAAAIESVVAQCPALTDIVVVDGDSDDGSADLARSFPGVRVLAQVGQGLAAARNQGVREVAGTIIGFCDADDRWTAGSLDARLAHLSMDSSCGAVIGHIEWTLLDGIPVAPQQTSRVGQTSPGYTPGALLVRRSAFETIGTFDDKLTMGCDSDWFVRLLQSDVTLRSSTATGPAQRNPRFQPVGGRGTLSPRTADGCPGFCESAAKLHMNVKPGGAGLDVLHIIPRFIGGGPERSLLAFVAEERKGGIANRHKVVVLESPVSLHMLLAARRAAVELITRPERDIVEGLIKDSGIVVIHFWNHPALATFLRTVTFPPARVLLWARILGTRAPQVLTEEVGCFGDRLALTSRVSEESDGARKARARSIPVDYVPGIIDTSRIDGFEPRRHEGVSVGYIGLVSPVKMHPRFPEMCASVRNSNIRFVVCGGGGGEDKLRSRFVELGLAERADVRGHVENIREPLEEFDIFGYPLVEDTYATSEKALQEAMWVGIPPVVFPHGGLRDVVENDHTGLVVTTEDEYVSAIERLACDPLLRLRLGGEACRFARHEFQPIRWSGTLNRIMTALMDEPRRPRAPLAGAGEGAAENFVRSLGLEAGAFADSLTKPPTPSRDQAMVPESVIARASPLLAFGEGGVVHYSRSFPNDPYLSRWADIVRQS